MKNLPKLYQYKVCPFCCKVRAMLAYKKIPYDAIEVHPLNKKEIAFSKDYRKVPIFIDTEGKQVNDSTNIMRYLEEKYPEQKVFETQGDRKQREEKWLDWADKKLVRALPPLIYKTLSDSIQAFDYISKEEKFSWVQKQFIKYSGAAVMTLVAKKSAKDQGIQNPEEHLKKCLKDWMEAFENKDFLGGDKPNAADLASFGILKSVSFLPAFNIVKKNAQAYAWFQRIEKLAS